MGFFSRRDLLAASGLATLGSLPIFAQAAPARRRVLRIAHVTDLHVQPERGAALGMERCLESAQSHKPDLIFMGGDQVMDSLGADRARVKRQWDVYNGVLKANVSLLVVHAIGNHDVWGWSNREKFCNEPGFGKEYALDQMGLARSYGSFDRAGWHFIVLDSVHRCERNGYVGKVGHDQFDWLADDLSKVPANKPVLIMSHIPILSVSAYFHGQNERPGGWHVPAAWMHIDARRLKELFAQHTNVNACISGHIHMNDRVEFGGVSYINHGAGCGAWWGGEFQGVAPGYGLVDLYNDGSVENKYVEYGWKPMA